MDFGGLKLSRAFTAADAFKQYASQCIPIRFDSKFSMHPVKERGREKVCMAL